MLQKNSPTGDGMKIGELAARSGVAPSTIRFYESCGLLPVASRGSNGYRLYAAEAVCQLQMIQIAQRLGFPLDAIRSVLASGEGLPQELILEKLHARLAEIDKLQAELIVQRQQVETMLATLNQRWALGECIELGSLAEQLANVPKRRVTRR